MFPVSCLQSCAGRPRPGRPLCIFGAQNGARKGRIARDSLAFEVALRRPDTRPIMFTVLRARVPSFPPSEAVEKREEKKWGNGAARGVFVGKLKKAPPRSRFCLLLFLFKQKGVQSRVPGGITSSTGSTAGWEKFKVGDNGSRGSQLQDPMIGRGHGADAQSRGR
jgi:hypothetical protein